MLTGERGSRHSPGCHGPPPVGGAPPPPRCRRRAVPRRSGRRPKPRGKRTAPHTRSQRTAAGGRRERVIFSSRSRARWPRQIGDRTSARAAGRRFSAPGARTYHEAACLPPLPASQPPSYALLEFCLSELSGRAEGAAARKLRPPGARPNGAPASGPNQRDHEHSCPTRDPECPALSPDHGRGNPGEMAGQGGAIASPRARSFFAEIENPTKATMEFEAVDEGKRSASLLVADGTEGVKVNRPHRGPSRGEGEEAGDKSRAAAPSRSLREEAGGSGEDPASPPDLPGPGPAAPTAAGGNSAGSPAPAASRGNGGERIFASPARTVGRRRKGRGTWQALRARGSRGRNRQGQMWRPPVPPPTTGACPSAEAGPLPGRAQRHLRRLPYPPALSTATGHGDVTRAAV